MFCESCAVESPSAVFCTICGAFLPSASVGVRPAVTRRLLALLVDLALAAFFLVLFLLTVAGALTPGLISVLVGAAVLLYLASFVRGLVFGQTLGKLALKLRVVDRTSGAVPGLSRMLARETAGKLVSGLALGLGFFTALRDPDRETWHDRFTRTAVLTDDPAVAAPETPLLGRPVWPFGAVSAVLLLLFVALAPLSSASDSVLPGRVVADAGITSFPAPSPVGGKPSAAHFLHDRGTSGTTLSAQTLSAQTLSAQTLSSQTLPLPAAIAPPPAAISQPQPTPQAAPSNPPQQASVSPLPIPAAAPQPVRMATPPSAAQLAPSRVDTATAPAPRSPATPTPRLSAPPPDPAAAVDETLYSWATAMAHNQPSEISSFYAGHLDRYFLVRNVSNNFVYHDKAAFVRSGRSLYSFKLSQVRVLQAEPGRVLVSAVKQWIVLNRGRTSSLSGATRSRIWLTNIDGQWKITGEQDLL